MIGRTLVPVGISLALLAVALPARAQSDTGFYIGTGVGRSKFETRQVTASIPPQTVKVQDTSTAVRVFGGYRPLRFLAIETGVVSFGNLKEPLGSDTNPTIFEASYGGWDAALVLTAPLADGAFDLFAKVGVARQRYDTLISDPVDPNFAVDSKTKDSQNSSVFGVGAQFNMGSDRNFGIRLEYNTYDVSLLAVDQTNIMASFVYRFSR